MIKHKYYQISQKSRYALRGLLELALQDRTEPTGVKRLADAQEIPTRFLEVILTELRQGGFVESVRGKNGGYRLARPAAAITAGEIIRFVESVKREDPVDDDGPQMRIKPGDFSENWLFDRVNEAISGILDETSLEDMVQQEMKRHNAYGTNYII